MFQPRSNARFIPGHPDPVEALSRDLRDGMRYTHNSKEQILPWRTTYLDLDRLPFVRRTLHDRFDWPVYRFDIPLYLGALEINGLQVNIPNRTHSPHWRFETPLHTYPFEVRLRSNDSENYWQLKAYIRSALGEPISGWERDDQLHSDWDADGLQIGLTYWFKSDISKEESGYASLNITHQRLFPEYFTDVYIASFAMDEPGMTLRTFDIPHCSIPDFYRNSQWVRFTPEAVKGWLQKNNHTLAVWYDPQHRKLGFAKDTQLCIIVDVFDNQHFMLEFIDHDRGHYSHELRALRPDGTMETVLSAGVGALEGVVEMLAGAGFGVVRKE